ncbi:Alkaline phosphatase synthesis transcriptional regulatory protein PhoP [Paraburkholderia sediminicola]|uniref:Alkaline phosphatase synthesis transcriptional regulatory protein PhoP n=1 Tax=Paraburkholderia sediminicola TaxID=458836 RepID=A0A6J5BEP2_9BURK|nr:response regulator [Paraburkholderia sediminicola]CAB3700992.1 Alkaline phosphatase synthesis transcriptional regulatory protein PhoP [Paraburkholderia sediminicola]
MSTAKAERLLIADDDPDLVNAYVLFFEAYGYDIRTAIDGPGALAIYCVWRPDVVMLDIQMPTMDGHAVAKEIRRMGALPRPLLLAVTALHGPYERIQSFRAGFDHHFVKPAQLPSILAAISDHPSI